MTAEGRPMSDRALSTPLDGSFKQPCQDREKAAVAMLGTTDATQRERTRFSERADSDNGDDD